MTHEDAVEAADLVDAYDCIVGALEHIPPEDTRSLRLEVGHVNTKLGGFSVRAPMARAALTYLRDLIIARLSDDYGVETDAA